MKKRENHLGHVADRLRTARENKGLSMRQAADAAGISVSTISRVENGIGLLSLQGFVDLCAALDLLPSVALKERR